MLGVSGLPGGSGDGVGASGAQEHGGSGGGDVDGAGGGLMSEEEKGRGVDGEGDRSSAGNRWPRQETVALIKIRSEMDATFRDSSLKGPIWEEVSRKLAELGYHRSSKKCKEKFENVYKYHKRTKEGRTSKADGKNYPFFDQLEALENHPLPPPSKITQITTESIETKMREIPRPNPPIPSQKIGTSTVPSISNPTIASQFTLTPTPSSTTNFMTSSLPPPPLPPPTTTTTNPKMACQSIAIRMLHSTSSSTTSSDLEPRRQLKRKRKWEGLLERLMEEVMHKQEELQRKFLEALERRERDRTEREESWRGQEMARMDREHQLLVQEKSMAAAKDASLIAFLHKISQQQPPPPPIQNPSSSDHIQMQVLDQTLSVTPPSPPRQPPAPPSSPPTLDNRKTETFAGNSSSRWPKTEVQALIRLRAELELKYQENGPKGPLWEEMSKAMGKLGYERSAKRCKEKWENINKYFKKVKESNKKRPQDSKTCPYFHQLDALYKERSKNEGVSNHKFPSNNVENAMVPIMVAPEQQWPLPKAAVEDREGGNRDRNNEDEDIENEEDEDSGGGGDYEMVTNKASSVATVE